METWPTQGTRESLGLQTGSGQLQMKVFLTHKTGGAVAGMAGLEGTWSRG